jgi:putative spermidine/putrescine transport system ATP-binding protein
MPYIRFVDLNKYYGKNHVLKDINLDIEKGQLVTLLGPSGCGKSTLLRCLAGLEEVTSGKVFLDEMDITDVSPRDRGIGMVFQQYSLFPNLSVAQNVAFGLKLKKEPSAEIDRG